MAYYQNGGAMYPQQAQMQATQNAIPVNMMLRSGTQYQRPDNPIRNNNGGGNQLNRNNNQGGQNGRGGGARRQNFAQNPQNYQAVAPQNAQLYQPQAQMFQQPQPQYVQPQAQYVQQPVQYVMPQVQAMQPQQAQIGQNPQQPFAMPQQFQGGADNNQRNHRNNGDPPFFYGKPGEDFEKWFDEYDAHCDYNNFQGQRKLASLKYCLKDYAFGALRSRPANQNQEAIDQANAHNQFVIANLAQAQPAQAQPQVQAQPQAAAGAQQAGGAGAAAQQAGAAQAQAQPQQQIQAQAQQQQAGPQVVPVPAAMAHDYDSTIRYLRAIFVTEGVPDVAFRKFCQREQRPGEDVSSFYYDLERLFQAMAVNGQYNEHALMQKFMNGLLPSYRAIIHLQRPANVREALEEARRMESRFVNDGNAASVTVNSMVYGIGTAISQNVNGVTMNGVNAVAQVPQLPQLFQQQAIQPVYQQQQPMVQQQQQMMQPVQQQQMQQPLQQQQIQNVGQQAMNLPVYAIDQPMDDAYNQYDDGTYNNNNNGAYNNNDGAYNNNYNNGAYDDGYNNDQYDDGQNYQDICVTEQCTGMEEILDRMNYMEQCMFGDCNAIQAGNGKHNGNGHKHFNGGAKKPVLEKPEKTKETFETKEDKPLISNELLRKFVEGFQEMREWQKKVENKAEIKIPVEMATRMDAIEKLLKEQNNAQKLQFVSQKWCGICKMNNHNFVDCRFKPQAAAAQRSNFRQYDDQNRDNGRPPTNQQRNNQDGNNYNQDGNNYNQGGNNQNNRGNQRNNQSNDVRTDLRQTPPHVQQRNNQNTQNNQAQPNPNPPRSANAIANRWGSIIMTTIDGMDFRSLFDTGAAMTLIRENMLQFVSAPMVATKIKGKSINQIDIGVIGQVDVTVNVGGRLYPATAAVIKEMQYDLVIGRDIIKEIGPLYLDMNRKVLFIPNDDILAGIEEKKPNGVIIPVASISEDNTYGIPDKPYNNYIVNWTQPPEEEELVKLTPTPDWNEISVAVVSMVQMPWHEWFDKQADEIVSNRTSTSSSVGGEHLSSGESSWEFGGQDDLFELEGNEDECKEFHTIGIIETEVESFENNVLLEEQSSEIIVVPELVQLDFGTTDAATAIMSHVQEVMPEAIEVINEDKQLYKIDIQASIDSEINVGAIEQPKIPVAENLERKLKTEEEFLAQFKLEKAGHSEERKTQLKVLLVKYREVFGEHDYDVGNNADIKLHIDTGDSPPIYIKRQIPVPMSQRPAVAEIIECMEKEGIIRKSKSPWAVPMLVVPKKDGRLRIVIDYRPLNKVLKKDVYPLPRIEDMLAKFYGMKFFTTLDLNSGFYNIEVEEASREKTAFVCFKGLYEYNRMPMGLSNSPAQMQRLAESILDAIDGTFAMAYIDDIMIKSETWEEHLVHLEKAFQAIVRKQVKIKASKVYLGQSKVVFLGFMVTDEGITINPERTDKIRNLPAPKTRKQVQQVLGFLSYYRKFIPNFSKKAAPIVAMLKKDSSVVWTEECKQIFDELKEILLGEPILHFPDLNGEFRIETDASAQGFGAVLSQEKDGILRPIAFASKTTDKYERVYGPTELEAAAITFATKKFRTYIWGRKCIIYTDHHGLQYLLTSTFSNVRIQRWALKLQDYTLEIIYRPGKKNSNVDLLSRLGATDDEKEKQRKADAEDLPNNLKFNNFPTNEEIEEEMREQLDLPNEVEIAIVSVSDTLQKHQNEDPECYAIIQYLMMRRGPKEDRYRSILKQHEKNLKIIEGILVFC